jgi:hypothetical protein
MIIVESLVREKHYDRHLPVCSHTAEILMTVGLVPRNLSRCVIAQKSVIMVSDVILSSTAPWGNGRPKGLIQQVFSNYV